MAHPPPAKEPPPSKPSSRNSSPHPAEPSLLPHISARPTAVAIVSGGAVPVDLVTLPDAGIIIGSVPDFSIPKKIKFHFGFCRLLTHNTVPRKIHCPL